MNVRSAIASLGFLLITAVFSAVLLSQSQNATISGTITDETKALIPGATVTAVDAQSGKRSSTVSDGEGKYRLADLPPGNYTVTASLPGFETLSVKDVDVKAQEQRSLNFALKVGGFQRGFLLPPAGPRDRDVSVRADAMTVQGLVTHYKGNVQMTTESVLVRADELDFNSVSQRADARGSVQIQVLPVSARTRLLTN